MKEIKSFEPTNTDQVHQISRQTFGINSPLNIGFLNIISETEKNGFNLNPEKINSTALFTKEVIKQIKPVSKENPQNFKHELIEFNKQFSQYLLEKTDHDPQINQIVEKVTSFLENPETGDQFAKDFLNSIKSLNQSLPKNNCQITKQKTKDNQTSQKVFNQLKSILSPELITPEGIKIPFDQNQTDQNFYKTEMPKQEIPTDKLETAKKISLTIGTATLYGVSLVGLIAGIQVGANLGVPTSEGFSPQLIKGISIAAGLSIQAIETYGILSWKENPDDRFKTFITAGLLILDTFALMLALNAHNDLIHAADNWNNLTSGSKIEISSAMLIKTVMSFLGSFGPEWGLKELLNNKSESSFDFDNY